MSKSQIRIDVNLSEKVEPDLVKEMLQNTLASVGKVTDIQISETVAIKVQLIFPIEIATYIPAADLLTEEGVASIRELLQSLAIQSLQTEEVLPIISSAQIVADDQTEEEIVTLNDAV